MANNASIVGSPTFGAAKFGNGLTNIDDTDYVLAPVGVTSAIGSTAASFTLEAQIKTTDTTDTQLILACGSTGLGNLALLFIASGTLQAYGTGSPGQQGDSGVNVADGAWHHCALVVTGGSSWALYVDGILRTTFTHTSYTGLGSATGMRIGTHWVSGDSFRGTGLDEVAVWRVAKYTSNFTPPSSAYTGTEANLVALYHLQSDGTDSVTATPIAPNNAAIIYSPFNWASLSSGALMRTVNAGAYFRTLFTGSSIALNFDTSANSTGNPYPQFWARIDNEGWQKFSLSAGNPSIAIATGLDARTHMIEVVAKSFTTPLNDWTAPAMGITLSGILLDSGAGLVAPVRRSKNVLIYGDSITAGHLTLGLTPGVEVDDNDSLGSWAYGVGSTLDAEFGIVGFGGTGLSTGGDGGVPALGSTFNLVYSGVSRSFTTPAPDLILFNEGTNDGANNIQAAYVTVINALLAACPTARMLLLVPFGSSFAANQRANILAVVATVANPRVTALDTGGWLSSSDTADGTHPLGYANIALIAPRIMPHLFPLLYPTAPARSFTYS